MSTVHEKICTLRKAAGLTQEQLGTKLGITGQAVSKWEKGSGCPDILLLPDLCDLFGITVDDLLRDTPLPEQSAPSYETAAEDFCRHARETGRNAAVTDIISRLTADSGKPSPYDSILCSPDGIRICDRGGMGFVVSNREYMEKILAADPEKTADFLKILTDPDCLRILRILSPDHAMGQDDICRALTGADTGGKPEAPAAEPDRELTEILKKVNSPAISTSLIQRKCSIGYGAAQVYLDRMKEAGLIEPIPGTSWRWAVKNHNGENGIAQADISRILLELMKRNLICCEEDPEGETGYLWNVGMTGVIMILTGCHAAGYGTKADEVPFCTHVSRYPDRNL